MGVTTGQRPSTPLADLPAGGPHPDHADRLALFGQFVGVWDLTVSFFDDDGRRVYREPGVWAFGWILDGRAIQDVLTYPRPGDPAATGPGRRGIGTSVRTLDPGTGVWQVIWFGVVTGLTVVLHGGADADGIHLEGGDPHDRNIWRFTDITADSFTWTGHESTDDGRTWRLRQHMTGRRRPQTPPR
jgi:hypothetical protein